MGLFNFLTGKKQMRDKYLNPAQDNFISRWARPPSMNTVEWLSMFSKSPRMAGVTSPIQVMDFLLLLHSIPKRARDCKSCYNLSLG